MIKAGLKRGSPSGDQIGALQASMNEQGVDLVIVGPTTNMRYLTGYGAMAVERITVLLVTRDRVAMACRTSTLTVWRGMEDRAPSCRSDRVCSPGRFGLGRLAAQSRDPPTIEGLWGPSS